MPYFFILFLNYTAEYVWTNTCFGVLTRRCYVFALILSINPKKLLRAAAPTVFMVWLRTGTNDMTGRTFGNNGGELRSLSTLNLNICLSDLEKTTRNFYNISLCPDRASNTLSPALKPKVLPLQPSCSIVFISPLTEAPQSDGQSLQMCCSSCQALRYSTWIFTPLNHRHYDKYSNGQRKERCFTLCILCREFLKLRSYS
jgi:hypothetical protein